MVFKRKWIHGCGTRAYCSWRAMISRCYNASNKDYYNYGARGIRVSDEWIANYDRFFEDMGERPMGLTLDRINPDGHYEPSNCRWATITVQANNTSRNVFIRNNGKIKTIAEWGKENGINTHTMAHRVRTGKAIDKIFAANRLLPDDYLYLKNIPRETSVFLAFEDQKLTIIQWAEKTGLNLDTIWNRIFRLNWTIEKALTFTTERPWSHGTNTGYSKYKCRCDACTEYNRLKSKKARDRLKLKQYG